MNEQRIAIITDSGTDTPVAPSVTSRGRAEP